MQEYDVGIVGDGGIGLLVALAIVTQRPSWRVLVCGNRAGFDSATAAAGAMHAVFGEVEEPVGNSEAETRALELGLQSRALWLDLFDRLGEMRTAHDTLIYLKADSSRFERKCFANAKAAAESRHAARAPDTELLACHLRGGIDIEDAFLAVGEFSICVTAFFETLTRVLTEHGVEFERTVVERMDVGGNDEPALVHGEVARRCGRVVLCAGVGAKALLRGVRDLFLYQGVGSALLTEPVAGPQDRGELVVRTVNRGGSQCGVHLVPRSDGRLYIGAGNYIESISPASHRLETLRYLIDLSRREILGTDLAYRLLGTPLLGLRPRTLDTDPLIGPLAEDPRVYLATGTNRVGLTLGPVIAQAVVEWVEGSETGLFAYADPNRTPRSYGDMEAATTYFVESRISNLLEHSVISASEIHETEKNLRGRCADLNEAAVVRLGLPAGHVVHPDFWGLLGGRVG